MYPLPPTTSRFTTTRQLLKATTNCLPNYALYTFLSLWHPRLRFAFAEIYRFQLAVRAQKAQSFPYTSLTKKRVCTRCATLCSPQKRSRIPCQQKSGIKQAESKTYLLALSLFVLRARTQNTYTAHKYQGS